MMIVVQVFFNISVAAGPAADQRHSSAIHFLRRIKPVCDARQRRRAAEREPADGVGGGG